MRTMALDASLTATGVVVYDHSSDLMGFGAVVSSKTIKEKLSSGASWGERTKRLLRISGQLVAAYMDFAPDFVLIEGPSYGSLGRQVDTGGLHYTIHAQFLQAVGVELEVRAPMASRLFVLNRGSPPPDYAPGLKSKTARTKRWVRESLTRVVGAANVPKSEHECDALVIALGKQMVPVILAR